MKSKIKFLPFILLFLVFGVSCDNSVNISETEIDSEPSITESFQAIIDSLYKAYPYSIGLMAHVESPKNDISWSGSAGASNKDGKTLLDPEQPFLIASSIKTYVSASILKLQEDQKLSIEDPISKHLSSETTDLFQSDGYDFNNIKIKHLLSHTSGIADYVNDDYIEWIDQNQKHRWTREEQLHLAVEVGDPLGVAQDAFKYADVNFVLCTEIIEQITNSPFPTAMRDLLQYEKLGLSNTWFPTLESKPAGSKELVNQYWNVDEWGPNKINIAWNSTDHDISWDLYGGGGIATNTAELAQFSYHLFNKNIIANDQVLDLITTDVVTNDGVPKNYRLGIAEASVKGITSYGHGGFWGTMVFYIPKLDASIAVCVLEREGKMDVIKSTLNALVSKLAELLAPSLMTSSESFELHKAQDSKATLVLFPGGGATAEDTKAEFEVRTAAIANNISVLFMNLNGGLWMDSIATEELTSELENIFSENRISDQNIFLGGMSIGGNAALKIANELNQRESFITPKGVFIVDSPLDLHALYESSIKDISNPTFDEERLAEPKWIAHNFEQEFGQHTLLENISKVSPFTLESNQTSVPSLHSTKVRFYIEPDSLWYKEVRQTDFESTNAFAIQQIAKNLRSKNWNHLELIETQNKGMRANGDRNPHSWSIVDVKELIDWMQE